MAKAKPRQNFFVRYQANIAVAGPNDCWLWTAGKFAGGYGQVWATGGVRRAHRAAYEAVHGEGSAAGLVVRHKCDVPACCNPAHLELGTNADNVRDKVERGRQARQCGATNANAKLAEVDVRAIRSAHVHNHPEFSGLALARRYGVSPTTISQIVNRLRWNHIA